MGISLTKPKAETVINQFLTDAPPEVFKPHTGSALYSYYYNQAAGRNLDVFADVRYRQAVQSRLERKIRQIAKTPQELKSLRRLSIDVKLEMAKKYMQRFHKAAKQE